MSKKIIFILLCATVILATSCNKDPEFTYFFYTPEEIQLLSQYLTLPEKPDDYTVRLSKNLVDAGLRAAAVDQNKAILGRVMFYDKSLSKDGTISCASCHKQEIGFSDDKRVSPGVYGRLGNRNAIALASVASFASYYGTDINGSSAIRFFWDNRAPTAGEQNKGSLTNPSEMDMHMNEVVDVVRSQPYYQPLLRKAFGTSDITADQVNEAIAHFVNAMGSYKSKFDEEASKGVYEMSPFPGFTASENHGKTIYMANCATCHSYDMGGPLRYFANNGLDANFTSDSGVGGVSGSPEQVGCFKVPTLRNIALTAPYMHDGRFQTLAEVVEHYNSGIQDHPNLDYKLKKNGNPIRMNLSESDKQDLVNFLHTLTDPHFTTDPRFSNPFK